MIVWVTKLTSTATVPTLPGAPYVPRTPDWSKPTIQTQELRRRRWQVAKFWLFAVFVVGFSVRLSSATILHHHHSTRWHPTLLPYRIVSQTCGICSWESGWEKVSPLSGELLSGEEPFKSHYKTNGLLCATSPGDTKCGTGAWKMISGIWGPDLYVEWGWMLMIRWRWGEQQSQVALPGWQQGNWGRIRKMCNIRDEDVTLVGEVGIFCWNGTLQSVWAVK